MKKLAKWRGFPPFIKKIVRAMKISVFLVLICTFQLSASVMLGQQVSLKSEAMQVREVFKELKTQTGNFFMYSEDEIDGNLLVNVDFSDVSLEVALKEICEQAELNYEVVDDYVLITKKAPVIESTVQQGRKTIKGTITDINGDSLPWVTIIEKGTINGVTTDIDGHYTISLLKENSILIFSFVGMITQEVKYSGQKEINIVLKDNEEALEEVVVTGYQSINRKDMVGSVTTIKAVDVIQPAFTTIDQMLQGQVAGMSVQNTSSRVGTTPKIRIRGTSTILGNRDPIWVVDGIIQPEQISMDASTLMTDDLKNIVGNQISWLNPSDIETITVLKDASATAIYGSKASNGVIVITTKKGEAGKTRINYTSNYSLRSRPSYDMFNVMNSQERIKFGIEAYDAGVSYNRVPDKQTNTYEGLMRMYLDNEIDEEFFRQELAKLETANTDWFDLLTRNSFSSNQNLSVSGGTSKLRYNASVSYNNSKGVEIGNDSERMSGRIRVDADVSPKLKVSLNLAGTRGTNDGYGPGVNPISYATNTSRAIRAYDDNGDNLYYQKKASYRLNNNVKSLGYNILNEMENSHSAAKTARINASLNLDWKMNSNFTYQLVMGYVNNNNNSEAYSGEKSYRIAKEYRGYDFGSVTPTSPEYKAAKLPYGGELFTANGESVSYNIQNKLLFSKTFKGSHRLNVMLGSEISSTDNNNLSNTVWGYVPERGEKIMRPTPINNIVPIGASVGNDLGIFEQLYDGRWRHTSQKNNFVSLFATMAYSIKNKYVFNANLRSDASNRFGQDVNDSFEPVWSAGFSWRMAQEDFIKDNLPWIDQARWRMTYGIQGNVLTSKSPELLAYQQGVASVYNQYTATISSLPNPYLKWEKTKSWNLGFDLQLFKILSMNLEYYNRSSNAIVSQPIAQEYGKDRMDLNGGLITNQGIEYTINITPIQTEDFVWTIGINSSKNWNKSSSAPSKIIFGDYLNGVNNKIVKEGYGLSSFWSFSFAGLDPETGYPTFNHMDLEEDKDIDPTSFLVYSGQKEPDFTGGLNTRIRYKGLSFGANFAVLLGAKKRLPNPYSSFTQDKLPEPETNLDRNLLDRWQNPGDENFTDIPALFTGASPIVKLPNGESYSLYDMWAQSDNRVVDASFLRCQQLSLSWNLNSERCARYGVSNIVISANVNNVFVIANKKFEGFDPELGNSVMPRTYSLGFNVSF